MMGCSALSAVGTLMGKPGVNVNAQVGKENVQQVVGQQERNEINADKNSTVTSTAGKGDGVNAGKVKHAKSNRALKSVGSSVETDKVDNLTLKTSEKMTNIQAEKVTYNEQIPFWVLLFALLGWILPTPSVMWERIKSWRLRRTQIK
jgi:hypothetical protein